MLAVIEVNKDLKPSILIRTYFNFLDMQFGRGIFLIFLSLFMLEEGSWFEWLVALGCLAVAGCDLIIGSKEAKSKFPVAPWNTDKVG